MGQGAGRHGDDQQHKQSQRKEGHHYGHPSATESAGAPKIDKVGLTAKEHRKGNKEALIAKGLWDKELMASPQPIDLTTGQREIFQTLTMEQKNIWQNIFLGPVGYGKVG